ncbi:MAG: YceD family protein [Verrucomicrobiota bacterium]
MEIYLDEIPDDGLSRSGELPASIFDLAPEDSIRPAGPVFYETTIFRVEEGVVFTGTLRGDFELLCVTCLEFFLYHAEFLDWSSDLDLEPDQKSFDFSQVVREDFLLQLPPSPRCDRLIEGRTCPKASLLKEAERKREEDANEPAGPDAWSALDQLKEES